MGSVAKVDVPLGSSVNALGILIRGYEDALFITTNSNKTPKNTCVWMRRVNITARSLS